MKRLLTCKRFFAFVACMAVLLSGGGLSAFAADTDATWEMTVPQIRVTTENGNGTALQKEDGYQNAQITITDTDGSVLTNNCQLKVRGNTTALSWIEKKAFTVKFDKKTDVLGMGKGKKWALVANAFDPTLLRNYMAFSLAKKLGLAYTSEFRFTELWVDGVFRGCYFLTEPVQEGKDRVDIDIESNDGKNDFLIEYEARRQEDDVTYFTVQGLRFIASEPEEPDEAHPAAIERAEDDYYVTVDHPMTKDHYISFLAAASDHGVQIVKLYPEGNAEARFRIDGVRRLYGYCNRHGLFGK